MIKIRPITAQINTQKFISNFSSLQAQSWHGETRKSPPLGTPAPRSPRRGGGSAPLQEPTPPPPRPEDVPNPRGGGGEGGRGGGNFSRFRLVRKAKSCREPWDVSKRDVAQPQMGKTFSRWLSVRAVPLGRERAWKR